MSSIESEVSNEDSDTQIKVTSSDDPVSQQAKNSILLEKISEIDEGELVKGYDNDDDDDESEEDYESRPATNTRLPKNHSQATFRSSGIRAKNLKEFSDSDTSSDEETSNDPLKELFALTELSSENYDDGSSHRRKVLKIYPNEIECDEDYETDLEEDLTTKNHEEANISVTIKTYKTMCENLNIVPCRFFMAHIEDQTLTLKYHQFSTDEIRAMAKPLWNNIHVEKLLLDGNWIQAEGAKYISRMIRQNDFITEVSLADNKIGETHEGILEVCRMLTENCILKKLNLSGNCITDKSIQALVEALEKNRLLKELDLSHNNLGEEAGHVLGAYISSNDSIEILNLSWNNFRFKGAKELANGIKENVRIKRCDVSFNGFDCDGGKCIAEVIKHNSTLEYFHVNSTRLTQEGAAAIANALQHNDSLKGLNLANNPLTTIGALAIIYGIKLNRTTSVLNLDLSEVPVIKEFLNVLKEVEELRPGFTCKYGVVISTKRTPSVSFETGREGKVDFEKIVKTLNEKPQQQED